MKNKQLTRSTVIGCGGMARHHIRKILENFDDTVFPVLCEPSDDMYQAMALVFEEAGLTPPPNEPDLAKLLERFSDQLDAAFILTPHVFTTTRPKPAWKPGLMSFWKNPW